MSSFYDNFTSSDRCYDIVTQRRSRNARCVNRNIKAEGNRVLAHLPAQFYCFERHIAANSYRGKLCKLTELKYICNLQAKAPHENTSSEFRSRTKLCQEIPILRLKMIPECSRLRKHSKKQNGFDINPLYDVANIRMQRKTVHFLPRSPAAMFHTTKGLATTQCKEKRKVLLHTKGASEKQPISEKTRNVSLKSLKAVSQKARQVPTKQDRQLLREYRIKKWINCPEISNEEKVTSTFQLGHNNSFRSCLQRHPFTQSSRGVKTMQERALSNLSKIESAVLSNNIPQQQKSKNIDPILRSADSGIWCDLAIDKNFKPLSFKAGSNIQSANSQRSDSWKSSSFDSQSPTIERRKLKNHKSAETTDLTQISFSSCNSYPTSTEKRTRNPPIVACSWYQNSKCISQTDIHSKDFLANSLKSSDTSHLTGSRPCQQSSHSSSNFQCVEDSKDESVFLDQHEDKELRNKIFYDNLDEHTRTSLSISGTASTKESYSVKHRPNKLKRCNSSRNNKTRFKARSGHLNHEPNSAHILQPKRHFMHNVRSYSIVCDKTSSTNGHNTCNTTYQTFSKQRRNHQSHCAKPAPSYYFQNHSSVSCLDCNNFVHGFHTNPLPNAIKKSSLRRPFSYSVNSQDISCYGVYLENSVKSCNPIYLTSEPGLIALKNGKNQAILLKCTCKDCAKSSHNIYSSSQTKPRSHLKPETRQRTTSYKIAKHHRARSKKTLSSRSQKSEFSSTTRVSNLGVWAMCFRCFDDESDSSFSGGSDTANDDEDDANEGDEFAEHGGEVSGDEDSGGGDSGSDSVGDESLNSAELYDDQNNQVDARQALGDGDDSDGPASLESECSDSLTELRSKSKRGGKSNDEDEDDDDDVTEDDDQFNDSWESLACVEGE